MPEGPEVECVKNALQKLVGEKIKKIELTEQSQKYKKYQGKSKQFEYFIGKIIKKITRYGKYLVWEFDSKKVILNHLGMTGMWYLSNNGEDIISATHPKLFMETVSGINAVFNDIRNFAQLRIFNNLSEIKKYPPIKNLGIDGLTLPFPTELFIKKLDEKKYTNKQIANILLDQKLVAGIGNIYKSESLHLAKIDPRKIVKNLSLEEKKRLASAISQILQKAVKSGGSSISTYRLPSGEEGSGQQWHQVYRKQYCTNCNSKIEKIIQNKRTTYFCPKCQK
ncbi:MAG: bifunctional DNA-formamidopyrimidine glycosylase/DNA-(apurinic or apyrimidinic site) lyase [Candidatus Heimdallarchaeaceae archaeon]